MTYMKLKFLGLFYLFFLSIYKKNLKRNDIYQEYQNSSTKQKEHLWPSLYNNFKIEKKNNICGEKI